MQISNIDQDYLFIIRKEIESFLSQIDYSKDVLEIAPTTERYKLKTDTLSIDPKSNCTYIADLCSEKPITLAKKYDILICTEVLEHVNNPFKATENLHSFLREGGIAYITTPFNFRKHGPLPDNWRFTDLGLKCLFSKWTSIAIEEVSSNRFLCPIMYKTIVAK